MTKIGLGLGQPMQRHLEVSRENPMPRAQVSKGLKIDLRKKYVASGANDLSNVQRPKQSSWSVR